MKLHVKVYEEASVIHLETHFNPMVFQVWKPIPPCHITIPIRDVFRSNCC